MGFCGVLVMIVVQCPPNPMLIINHLERSVPFWGIFHQRVEASESIQGFASSFLGKDIVACHGVCFFVCVCGFRV